MPLADTRALRGQSSCSRQPRSGRAGCTQPQCTHHCALQNSACATTAAPNMRRYKRTHIMFCTYDVQFMRPVRWRLAGEPAPTIRIEGISELAALSFSAAARKWPAHLKHLHHTGLLEALRTRSRGTIHVHVHVHVQSAARVRKDVTTCDGVSLCLG